MSINRIRAFNRFYTGKIGLITNRFLNSKYSLVQARLLFELHHGAPLFASDISKKLNLSPDHLSKMVSKFESMNLIVRTPSKKDARKQILELTQEGKAAYLALRSRSNKQIQGMIQDLSQQETDALTSAMDTIEQVLEPGSAGSSLVTIRSHRPGDIGYVIHRHGVLYSNEYGFNHEFDAYVAQGMAGFIQNISDREHLWIAENQGKFAGSVAVVRRNNNTAQLRWLIVEPGNRKKGIGKQLVNEAVRFSKEKKYRSILLWTIDFLDAARHLYDKAGFRLDRTKTSQVWGQTLNEECWKKDLN